MNSQRILELDALRGIAALSVVIYHYFYRYDEIYGHQGITLAWSGFGQYGVHLFFMVSGFVIFWSLNNVQRPLDFLVSRFSRLYPAYWAAVIVTFITIYSFGLPGREVSIENVALNFLMFHEYLKVPHVDGVYWTLTIELTFYFWIFLLFLSSQLNKVVGIFSVLVLVSVCHTLGIVTIPSPIYKLFILHQISLFLAGICFYKLASGSRNAIDIAAIILSLLSTIVTHSFEAFFVFSCFYIVFYLAVQGHLKMLSVRPLIFLGGISYSLYLLHQNIGYVIINKAYDLQLNPFVGTFGALAVVITLATLFMKFIEKPALKAIRGAYKQNKTTVNTSTSP